MVPWPALISIVALVINVLLLAYILRINPRGRANLSYGLFVGTFIIWTAGETILRLNPEGRPEDLLPWVRLEWVGITILPAAQLHFVLTFPRPNPIVGRWPLLLLALYSIPATLIALEWTTPDIISGVAASPLGPDAATGPLYAPAAIVVVLLFVLSDVQLVLNLRRESLPLVRARSWVLLVGVVHTNIIGVISDALWSTLTGSPTRSGLGSILTLDLAAFVAYAIVRYRFLHVEAVVEEKKALPPTFPVKEGLSYLFANPDRSTAFTAFRSLATAVPGLCITATPPTYLTAAYDLSRTPILWLTRAASSARVLRPNDLSFEVLQTALRFMRGNPTTVVLVDDVDYLVAYLGFRETISFVKSLADQASLSHATLMIRLDPAGLPPQELSVLKGAVDHVEEGASFNPPPRAPPRGLLLLGEAPWSRSAFLGMAPHGPVLWLTPTHPGKVEQEQGPTAGVEYLWLTESAGEGRLNPRDLEAALPRALARWGSLHKGGFAFVEGLDYLLAVNEPGHLVDFCKTAVDLAGAYEFTLIAAARPEALNPRLLALIAGRFQEVRSQAKIKGLAPR